ncbi:MAG TPA: class I SAM-dependent methyltransferase [Acidimicrobiales bacterium]|nr:class I SAM-dependent methyltransferase [Acidimicrobiales bacterium]
MRVGSREPLPLPPVEMRRLVGVEDPAFFDNPDGAPALPEAGELAFGSVFDFGCGCGRIARRLIQQEPQPRSYLGIDLHAGMVRWCQEHLTPLAPQFRFLHHDVHNIGLNPRADGRDFLPFPAGDGEFDLVVAHSVFTHVLESSALAYLRECARILDPDGLVLSTWFLFDKRLFPMMQPFQNALYINEVDPTNAVIFDRAWFERVVEEAGLVVTGVVPPAVRGFAWTISLRRPGAGRVAVPLPEDDAPLGHLPPPVPTVPAYTIGRDA